jgi:hypothetical protein
LLPERAPLAPGEEPLATRKRTICSWRENPLILEGALLVSIEREPLATRKSTTFIWRENHERESLTSGDRTICFQKEHNLLLKRELPASRKIATYFLRENRLLFARDHLLLKKEPLATGKPTCFWRENHLLPE